MGNDAFGAAGSVPDNRIEFDVRIKERISLEIPPNEFNRFYLETKKAKFGHILSLDTDKSKQN